MPHPPLEKSISYKRRYVASVKGDERPMPLDQSPMHQSADESITIDKEAASVENDFDCVVEEHHKASERLRKAHLTVPTTSMPSHTSLSSSKRRTSLSSRIAAVREQNESLVSKMQDGASYDIMEPSLYKRFHKKPDFPRTQRKIHSSAAQNRHKAMAIMKRNAAGSASSPSIVVERSVNGQTGSHKHHSISPARRFSGSGHSPHASPVRAWTDQHANGHTTHTPKSNNSAKMRSPKLSPLIQMYADYSPPQWNSHIPETSLSEINDKILMFERELNRLYQKKKKLLSPQPRTSVVGAAGVTSSPIPLEQRLKKLYDVLPVSSKKVFRQTISNPHHKPSSSQRARKLIVHDHDVAHIVWCQSILRMIQEKLIFEREWDLHRQISLERPAVDADHLSTESQYGQSNGGMADELERDEQLYSENEEEKTSKRLLQGWSEEEDVDESSSAEDHVTAEEDTQTTYEKHVAAATHEEDSATAPAIHVQTASTLTNEQAASLIQRVFRRHRTNQFVLVNHSARRIQRRWKRYLFLKSVYGDEGKALLRE